MPGPAVPDARPYGRRVALGGLVKACHPGPSLVVTGLAAALGLALGLTLPRVVLVTAAVLAGQLSIGWLNDLHDRADDAAAGRPDKPLAGGQVSVRAVRAAWVVASFLVLPLSAALGPRAGAANLVTVLCGWAYDLRLKATVWSWLPFAVAFGLLPAVVVLSLPPPPPTPPWWGCAAGALLGVGAHVANALPDIDSDRALGVGGLPARLGAGRSRALAGVLLVAATLLLAVAPPGPPGAAGWLAAALALVLLALGLVRPWPVGSRAPFVLVAALAVLDVLLLVVRAGAWAPTG